MRYFLSTILLFAWGLWIGGQATLVLLIVTLFVHDRPTAIHAGPTIFPVFEKYQLILAAIAIVDCAILAVWTRRKMFISILVFFIFAAIGGIVSRTLITPRMVGLWKEQRSEGAEFAELHKRSQLVYNSEFILLLVGGSMIPAALRPARKTAA